MSLRATGRQSFALVVSAGVHVGLLGLLLLLPAHLPKSWDIVDMAIARKAPPPPPPPEVQPEEPEKEDPARPKARPKPAPEEPPPPPEEAPPEPEKAPPVFDLGDNTFAENGSGASWSLGRSEGNTKLAGFAKPGQKSARGTSPDRGSGSAAGFRPVPAKDLSKRPEPTSEIRVPPYPQEATRQGIEGRVILQVFIGRDGAVKSVRVIKDPGGGLGEVARAAMLSERWKPALDKGGAPVDTVITYSYLFVLDG